MSVKVHLVFGPSGEYEDYFEELIGVFFKEENAKLAGERWYKEKTNPDLPMSFEEYEEFNEGYADDDYDQEGSRSDKGGFSVADFEKMDEAWSDHFTIYYEPRYEEHEIEDISSLEELSKLLSNERAS